MCSNQSFRPAAPTPGKGPLSPAELMRLKEDIKDLPKEQQREIIDYMIWGAGCCEAAEEQYRREWAEKLEKEKNLIDNIKKVRKKLDEEKWVFEEAANGWI